jgi:hypothetical protein
MRFFFDLKSEQHTVLDYSGEDFRRHEAAIDFAKAIADDMTHRASRQWLGWSVEVLDEVGRQFISVPIRTAGASGLS